MMGRRRQLLGGTPLLSTFVNAVNDTTHDELRFEQDYSWPFYQDTKKLEDLTAAMAMRILRQVKKLCLRRASSWSIDRVRYTESGIAQ